MTTRQKKEKVRLKKNEQKNMTLHAPKEVVALVSQLAEPLCRSRQMELVHVEYQRETAGWVLRLYIDQPDGVTLEDCTFISRQLSDLLDVNIENIGPYHMEVSSPGPDRPLGKEQDYERFQGNMVRIKTAKPVAGRKNFKGILGGLAEGFVRVLIGDKTVAIPFREIIRARLVNYNGENRCL